MMKNIFKLSAIITTLSIVLFGPAVSASSYLNAHDASNLWLKDGAYNTPWQILRNDSQGFASVTSRGLSATSTRFAYTDGNGIIWLKDGGVTSPWIQLSTGAYQVALSGDKIFMVTWDLKLYGKQGDYRSQWVLLKSNVSYMEASSNRIAVLSNYDGFISDLSVKEGSLQSAWVKIAQPVTNDGSGFAKPSFSVSNNRVAFISYDSYTPNVKEGSLYGSWRSDLWTSTGGFINVSDNRVCVNAINVSSSSFDIYCKDGALETSWVRTRNNAVTMDVTDDKISSINYSGTLGAVNVLEGKLNQNSGWQTIDNTGWVVISR